MGDEEEDENLKLARQLQMEFDNEHKSKANGVKCQYCSKETSVEDLFILDDCTHKFCQPCLKEYVKQQIAVSVAIKCPIQGCGKTISVRGEKTTSAFFM